MPNILTHDLFAMDVLGKLKDEKIKAIIKRYPKEYHIGANGPDFLFYYNVFPWQNSESNKRISSYGGLVHRKKINQFFEMAIVLCNTEEDSDNKEAMISFLAGHICHWVLDSSTHPMIFYRSDGTTKETVFWHYRYESMIDTKMVMDIKKEDIMKYPTYEMLDYDGLSVDAITNIYEPILKKYWDIEIDKKIVEKCLHDFRSAAKMLFAPSAFFFYFLQTLERLIGKKWMLTSHMILRKSDHKHDVLNLKHDTWYNPCDKNISSTQSFVDIYEEGIEKAAYLLDILYESIQKNDASEITSFMNNRSYETGLPELKEMTDYKSIY